ncbi:uncharacterized protein LOC117218976 [Megalopta genalis]|uniref:uncharacterized protein LOC117218976 n=1 Tax=Megalopta genalis TaxID=115081 RepID=UPI003FD6815E
MNERLRYKRALVLVLAVVLHSSLPCRSFEIFVDAPSAPEIDFAEEQRDVADSAIERIFQSPKNRRNAASGSKHEIGAETADKVVSRRSPAGENLVRAKREGARTGGERKGPKEAAKAAEKRSVAGRSSPRAVRTARVDRSSRDYEAGLDDGSDYAEEFADDSVAGSDYKNDDSKLAEDGFIDRDERSILYDDPEEKDVAKRGVAGAEDYEELNDRVDEPEDGMEDRGSSEEAAEKGRARGDAGLEREHASKKREVAAAPSGSDPGTASKKESAVAEDSAGKKDSRLAEDRPVDAEKEVKLGEDRTKPDRATTGDEADQSKRNVVVDEYKPIPDADGSKLALPANDRARLATEEAKAQDSSPSCDKKAAAAAAADDEPPDPSGASKLEEAKVAEELAPAAVAVAANAETSPGNPENSINPDGPTAERSAERSDRDYEKRVEEQIQRKIDSIKEEIKREIAESEKLEEIESNNAKFDELLDQREDEQDAEQEQPAAAAAEAGTAEKRANPSKRSAATLDGSRKGANGDERSTKRRKRQDAASSENVGSSAGSSSKLAKKSTGEGASGKRFVAPSLSARGTDAMAPRKRDAPREAYLVERDRSKRKRRRRSKEYERGSSREALKVEDRIAV